MKETTCSHRFFRGMDLGTTAGGGRSRAQRSGDTQDGAQGDHFRSGARPTGHWDPGPTRLGSAKMLRKRLAQKTKCARY